MRAGLITAGLRKRGGRPSLRSNNLTARIGTCYGWDSHPIHHRPETKTQPPGTEDRSHPSIPKPQLLQISETPHEIPTDWWGSCFIQLEIAHPYLFGINSSLPILFAIKNTIALHLLWSDKMYLLQISLQSYQPYHSSRKIKKAPIISIA